jgi:hypothetical protein
MYFTRPLMARVKYEPVPSRIRAAGPFAVIVIRNLFRRKEAPAAAS